MDEILARLDQLLDGQHRLAADVAALRQAVESSRRREVQPARRPLKPDDRKALDALLPAISKAIGARTFSVRMLAERAALADGPGIALRAVLASVGSPHKIGRLLLRTTGAEIGSCRIVESGPSREGMLRTIVTIRRESRIGRDTRAK